MRYVVGVEDKYYVLQRSGESVEHNRCTNLHELLNELATAQNEFVHVIFDEQTLTETPLQEIYRKNKSGRVQLFYIREKSHVDIYIIDEHGSLFKHRQQFFNIDVLLGHFDTFLYSAYNRQAFSNDTADRSDFSSCIEYYEIKHGHSRGYTVKAAKFSPAQTRRSYFEVAVIIEHWDDTTEPNYRIFCQDKEFSSLEYGSAVFDSVAKDILKQRSGTDNYPIYITDIDIAGELPAERVTNINTTILCLQYKSQIETQLNSACERIREKSPALIG
jgi:adenylate cyclase class 1